MKRKYLFGLLLALAVGYAVVVSALFPRRGALLWSSLFLTMAAFLLAALVLRRALRADVSDDFLRVPVLAAALVYPTAQAALSLYTIFRLWPVRLAVAAQALLMLLFLVAALLGGLFRAHAVDAEAPAAIKRGWLMALRAQLEGLSVRAEDPEVRRTLESLADELRYADPMSPDSLIPLENQIQSAADQISSLLSDRDAVLPAIQALSLLLQERSRTCKLLK